MSIISFLPTDVSKAKKFLKEKLGGILEKNINEELESVLSGLKENTSADYLSNAFSKAVRLFGRSELKFSADEYAQAGKICEGWRPPRSIDKAVRTLILLQIPNENETEYVHTIEDLFSTADAGEQVVIYSALPLFYFPEKFIPRCMEGVRSNMGEVFEAVANENPFPSNYLPEDAFNQMVLKSLFVGKPLYKIQNLHKRPNKKLAHMASDYAHERWAAGRELNPETWQLVGDFLEMKDMTDMYRLSRSENYFERMAAAICCSQCQITDAEEIYAMSEYKMKVESGELNWRNLGVEIWTTK
ncbi:MAG: EboA domain-containing protein [Bacteroidetes bacterium]|nr:EboA domain-containing protein [Bacteroidota bacterium]